LVWHRRSASPACSPGFLFGVTARHPLVFVTVPLLLSAVAFLGAGLVNPVVALRAE
jgi:hypothetical protein